ncbi:MAG: radical SAM protein, partial [Oscillospiraceae bacterium]|nr:radical SAM protein [Oscillospiraceae bacterium]
HSTTIEQDLERIYTLRDMGYWPYVMIYDKANCKDVYTRLQRWVNNRFVFAKCDRFENYKKMS